MLTDMCFKMTEFRGCWISTNVRDFCHYVLNSESPLREVPLYVCTGLAPKNTDFYRVIQVKCTDFYLAIQAKYTDFYKLSSQVY